MKKLRCLIVDDEPVARKVLSEFVARTPYLALTGEFGNVADADAFLHEKGADLLFLDIEMPKRSGLQYLKASQGAAARPAGSQPADAGAIAPPFPEPRPLVILTTAFPKYALEGYELDIIDYLLKPIAFGRFQKAAQKAMDYASLRDAAIVASAPGPIPASASSAVPAPAASSPASPNWLFVRSEKKIERIEMRDILYMQSIGNYVAINTPTRRILAYLTLKGLEAQLPAGEFLKIHQSFLIPLARIDSIEGNQVVVGNKSLPLSRNYREAVMEVVEKRLLKR